MQLPKLEYDYSDYSVSQGRRLRRFIDLNLPLHQAPVMESLRLKFSHGAIGSISSEDIKLWVLVAVLRCVHELSLEFFSIANHHTELPSSLYVCKSIVMLILKGEILVDVPRMVCLPSLKTLFLGCVTYSRENSLHQLLSNCPVLEDLVVERDNIDNLWKLRVIVKSLQRLTLKMSSPCYLDGIMINTPSLKYLKVIDERVESDSDNGNDSESPIFSYSFEDMPKLEEADFVLTFQSIKKFFRSITSVKRLSLCLGVYTVQVITSVSFWNSLNIVFLRLNPLLSCAVFIS